MSWATAFRISSRLVQRELLRRTTLVKIAWHCNLDDDNDPCCKSNFGRCVLRAGPCVKHALKAIRVENQNDVCRKVNPKRKMRLRFSSVMLATCTNCAMLGTRPDVPATIPASSSKSNRTFLKLEFVRQDTQLE